MSARGDMELCTRSGYFFRTPAASIRVAYRSLLGLGLKGIDNFEKGEPVEVRIPGVDPPDSLFAHQNGCVRVVKQVAC